MDWHRQIIITAKVVPERRLKMHKTTKRIWIRVAPDNPILDVQPEERSKKADVWLQMGANIERLESAIMRLERVNNNNFVPSEPVDRNQTDEYKREQRDLRLIKSIIGIE